MPAVTVLLGLGVAVGPEALDLLPPNTTDWFPVASTLALTMIGFLLGAEFTADAIHRQGRANFALALIQGLVAATLVSVGLWMFGVEGELAVMLGGIAVATAPAATLAVVQKQRARGPFARRLISIGPILTKLALGRVGEARRS